MEQRIKEGFAGQRMIVLPRIIVNLMEDDPVCSSLHVTDIGYFPNAASHYVSRENPIDQYVFIYCADGEGWYSVDGRRHVIMPNQFCVLPPGVPHAYGAGRNPWSIYWIHYKGTQAGFYMPNSKGPVTMESFSDGQTARSRHSLRVSLFLEIFNTLHRDLSIDNLRYSTSMLHHYLGARLYSSQHSPDERGESGRDHVVMEAVSYMEDNISSQLRLEDICSHVNYSPSHFSQLFRRAMGYSPLAYFNIMKIRKACSILASEDVRFNQLCHRVGISDPYYFSRLFSRVMGMSAKDYCRTYLEERG